MDRQERTKCQPDASQFPPHFPYLGTLGLGAVLEVPAGPAAALATRDGRGAHWRLRVRVPSPPQSGAGAPLTPGAEALCSLGAGPHGAG